MNIVVFGCDNSGKTTLAKSIEEILRNKGYNANYIHSPGYIPNKDDQKIFMSSNLSVGKNNVSIFDRFPIIEENTCGIVLRNYSRFNFEENEEYNKEMLSNIDLFVYCFPGLFNVINWGEREQMDGIKDNILGLINEYNKFTCYLKENNYNVIIYNYKHNDIDNDVLGSLKI